MAPGGERDRLIQLVSEHVPEALRFAVGLTGRLDLAEEVVQEALYRAARSFQTFRGESQFRTWLFRIVLSAWRDHGAAARRDARRQLMPDELVDRRATDPSTAAMAGELGELIAARVSALPPRQREVLVLIAYHELSPREVATVLGISEANVHVNLHHARARLRRELAAFLVEK